MGTGPFGRDRPLTAGDEGLFGAPRPLVGAANALEIRIERGSAIEFASATTPNPDYIILREELGDARRELAEERRRAQKLKEMSIGERFEAIGVDPSDLGPFDFFDPLERAADRVFEMEEHVEELEEKLEETPERITRETAEPHTVEDAVEDDITDILRGQGVSRVLSVVDNGEAVIVTTTITNLNERKIEEIRDSLEDDGFIVEDIKPLEL